MSADIERLRADAEGARGVADRNPEVHYTADNIDAAADEIEVLRRDLREAHTCLREIGEYDVSPEVQKVLDVALLGVAR